MDKNMRGVVLVGHGGVPKDCPNELIMKLKRLEAQRRAAGSTTTAEELELDAKIRNWPRTAETDPYKTGLEALGQQLKARLNGQSFALAYNEFCAPTLEEAVRELVNLGTLNITVVSSMFTPGGSHSEIEIPETIEHLKKEYPQANIRYAWPFGLGLVADMLAEHLKQTS